MHRLNVETLLALNWGLNSRLPTLRRFRTESFASRLSSSRQSNTFPHSFGWLHQSLLLLLASIGPHQSTRPVHLHLRGINRTAVTRCRWASKRSFLSERP